MLVSSQKSAAGFGSVVLLAIAFVACSSSQTVLNAGDTDGGTDGGLLLKDSGGSISDDGASNTACLPADVSTINYTPPGAARAARSDCNQASITAFVDACLAKKTPTENDSELQARCKTWLAATENAACGKCLVTTRSEATGTGPFFGDRTTGVVDDFNLEGCLDQAESGCGPAYGGFFACIATACNRAPGGNCSDPSTTQAEFQGCFSEAAKGGCNSAGQRWISRCKGAMPASGPGTGDACFQSDTETDLGPVVNRLANRFCNAAPTNGDAGTDASTDAARDATPN